MLENPGGDPKLLQILPPMAVNTCFNKLEVRINTALLTSMSAHLESRENSRSCEGDAEDTDFDRWVHGQICQSEYNML